MLYMPRPAIWRGGFSISGVDFGCFSTKYGDCEALEEREEQANFTLFVCLYIISIVLKVLIDLRDLKDLIDFKQTTILIFFLKILLSPFREGRGRQIMKKLFTFLLALVASVSTTFAHDATIGNIYYLLDSDYKTATVTYRGEYYDDYNKEYSGSVVIPSSVTYNGTTYRVTSIGSHAFDGCDSLLSFTYQGTLAQWKKIKLGYFWKTPISTAVLHCTDGDVEI